jgi:hypothetical protein
VMALTVFFASLFAQRGLNPVVFNYAVTDPDSAEAIPQPYVSGPRTTNIWNLLLSGESQANRCYLILREARRHRGLSRDCRALPQHG